MADTPNPAATTPVPAPTPDPATPNPAPNPAPTPDPAPAPGANAPAIDPNNPPADPAKPAADPAKPNATPLASENWRQELAGDDEKALKALERIPSQKDLLKSWMEQRALISAGKHKQPLPKDATPEQVKEYREANGIPETAEGYYKALPEGMTFGEDDKPGVTMFLQKMHGKNAPPELVAEALQTYVAAQEEASIARAELDIQLKESGEELLRGEWGPDYKTNLNAVNGFLEANFPQEVQAAILNARLGDDKMTPLMSHPGMVKALAQLGRTLNPTGTTTPGAGMDKLDAIEDAIKGYEKRMTTKEWFKDEKAQAHYRQLVTARDKMTKKTA